MQLEELLQERATMMKRLESASREFTVTSKKKKVMFTQLEQAEGVIDTLRQQVDTLLKERDFLEQRCQALEDLVRDMKVDQAKQEGSPSDSGSDVSGMDIKEHVIDKFEEVRDLLRRHIKNPKNFTVEPNCV